MMDNTENTPLVKWLDSQEFYEWCQQYRHAKDLIGNPTAAQAFDALRAEIARQAAMQTRTLEAACEGMAEALEKYALAGVGNSTDYYIQGRAYVLATAALSSYRALKEEAK